MLTTATASIFRGDSLGPFIIVCIFFCATKVVLLPTILLTQFFGRDVLFTHKKTDVNLDDAHSSKQYFLFFAETVFFFYTFVAAEKMH